MRFAVLIGLVVALGACTGPGPRNQDHRRGGNPHNPPQSTEPGLTVSGSVVIGVVGEI